MLRGGAVLIAVQLVAGLGCATDAAWTPTVDTFGNERAQYLSRDTAECRALAQQAGASSGNPTQGAVRGAAVGAAGGAAMGAVLGNAGRGAAIGALAGGLSQGTRQAAVSDANFRRAFSNCLRSRGHNVLN